MGIGLEPGQSEYPPIPVPAPPDLLADYCIEGG